MTTTSNRYDKLCRGQCWSSVSHNDMKAPESIIDTIKVWIANISLVEWFLSIYESVVYRPASNSI